MKQDNNQEIKQGKGPLSFFKSNRFKHGGMSAVITIVFILVVVLVNVLTGLLADRFPSINVDMTALGLNTLSEKALEAAKAVEKNTEIVILFEEEAARKGGDYSQVVNLAERMNEVNRKITVTFKDLDADVSFKDSYEGETLGQGDVIVRTDDNYRILTAYGDLFTYEQNEAGNGYDYYSTVDGTLANALAAVNSDMSAKVVFATGHSEALTASYRASVEQMLKEQLFSIEEVNIMTGDLPEDADLLIIPAPSTDYTKEEIEKLRTFLEDTSGEIDKMMMYIVYPGAKTPNLTEFLEEWGVATEFGYVMESDMDKIFNYNYSSIMVDSTGTLFEEDSYKYLMSPMSSPLKVLFDYNDDISVEALWTTSETSYLFESEETDPETAPKKSIPVATLSRKMMSTDGSKFANVMVFGSATAFTDAYAGNNTFGNQRYYIDLISKLSGREASIGYVAPIATNKADIAASGNTMTVMGLGVFTVGIPLFILAVGLIIFLRRRHK